MRKGSTYRFIEEISCVSEYKNEVYEILIPLILSRQVFKNSKELKIFVNEVIHLDIPNYLFKSRTLLLGRVLKEINDIEIEEAVKINHNIIEFIDSIQNTNNNEEVRTKSEKRSSSFFSDWNALINKEK